MIDLNCVNLNLGLEKNPGYRSIGFHEGPYSRTAQVKIPEDWAVFVYGDYDDDQALRQYDARRRSIFCLGISPDGSLATLYKWRIGERSDPIHLSESNQSLHEIDHQSIIHRMIGG